MSLSKERIALIDQIIALAREKGYHEETIEILLMMTCAKPMIESVGSSEEAERQIFGFIKESETSQECLEKTLKLAGIDLTQMQT